MTPPPPTPHPPPRPGTGPGDSSQGAERRPPRLPPPLPRSPQARPLPQGGGEEKPQQARGLRDATAAPAPPAEGPRRRGVHPPPSPARPRVPVEPPNGGAASLGAPLTRSPPGAPPAAPSPRLKDRKRSAATQHQDAEATGAPPPRLPYIEASPPSARRLFQKPPEPSGRTLPNRRRGRAPAPAPAPAPWTPPAPTQGPRGPTPSRPAPNGRAARARAARRAPARRGALGKVSRLPGHHPQPFPGARCVLRAGGLGPTTPARRASAQRPPW
ncbi:proline-rich protein 2-like [Mesoplodon densirostris]|uniref:proline-rich protein 2-like n=1 Tax=Mesoplodon densirostris TaxID=48708 RepID=UPI0028DC505F|nr:proline-rich protein 2-like [Mesoplodon densirostris]